MDSVRHLLFHIRTKSSPHLTLTFSQVFFSSTIVSFLMPDFILEPVKKGEKFSRIIPMGSAPLVNVTGFGNNAKINILSSWYQMKGLAP